VRFKLLNFFQKRHDKKLLQSLNKQIANASSFGMAIQIVIAENIDEKYTKSLDDIKRKNKDESSKYFREKSREEGERFDQLLKLSGDKKLHLCQLGESSVNEALYHCLYSGSDEVKIESNEIIMEFILISRMSKTMYEDEIIEILTE
jgi:hypothetical protein